ncbi:hypothetical protein EV681_2900 [Advenella incenata]|jgi:hypothetical protein|uniref:Uncharacterized protein n=1 Tax=Advenella incenata TaxID=267800 RepID=A0A4Q7VEN5_9BURK|nr:hypothetical protein [Advenella incenata]RZT94480.1 hypothetical protein EV681_2900 [Advenella incenata]
MTVYLKKFENVYEKDLTSDIDGIETVYVKDKTTFNYTNGLTIDATGKTFYRKANTVDIQTPKHTLDYQTSETHGYAQAGFAAVNIQVNIVNTAIAGWKTETSTSYNLAGGLFINPSPIKISRKGSQRREHRRVHEFHMLWRTNKVKESVIIDKTCTLLYQLHMWGI